MSTGQETNPWGDVSDRTQASIAIGQENDPTIQLTEGARLDDDFAPLLQEAATRPIYQKVGTAALKGAGKLVKKAYMASGNIAADLSYVFGVYGAEPTERVSDNHR